MAKSKLRQMAEAGNLWAIATLQRQVLAGRKGAAKDRILRGCARNGDLEKAAIKLPPTNDPAFAQAIRDAEDIRQWTHGPRAERWRIERLALALYQQAARHE